MKVLKEVIIGDDVYKIEQYNRKSNMMGDYAETRLLKNDKSLSFSDIEACLKLGEIIGEAKSLNKKITIK